MKDSTMSKKNCINAVLLAFLSSLAICIQNGMYILTNEQKLEMPSNVVRFIFRLSNAIKPFDYTIIIVVILLLILYYKLIPNINKKMMKIFIPISIIFSMIILICDSYADINSWNNVFGNKIAVLTSLLRMVGLSIMIYFVLDTISKLKFNIHENTEKSGWKKNLLLISIVVICWIPYFIIFYPGCMNPDTRDQFAQITNNRELCSTARAIQSEEGSTIINNHHPVFFTLILSLFVKLGGLINSYSFSLGLYCIIQLILLAGALIFELQYLQKLGLSKKISKILFWVIALNPLFPIWGMTIMKDTIFSILLLLCATFFYDIFRKPNEFNIKKSIILSVLIMLLILIRNNGIYLAIAMIPFIIIFYRKQKKFLFRIIVTIFVPIIIYKVFISGIIFNALNIKNGSIREMMSIPFQQTARYIVENKEEITEEEKDNILKILVTKNNSLEEIAKVYDPGRSDNVKGKFNKDYTKEDLKNYFKTWIEQFKKHPSTYAQALFNLDYPWFSSNSKYEYIYYKGITDKNITKILPGVENPPIMENVREVIWITVNTMSRLPIVSILFKLSTYTWLYLICFIMLIIKKRKEELLACAFIFVNYLICFAGPIAYLRYALPMIICAPFVVFITFREKKD